MKKILLLITFIAASIAVVMAFLTSSNYTQLAIASLMYPPLVYFAFTIFPHNKRNIYSIPTVTQPVQEKQELKSDGVDIVDIDKRAFLKLIGAAGLSYFIFSIFTRRAENMFLGRAVEEGSISLKDTSGVDISPAEKQPTDGYQISEIDDAIVSYYGFTNNIGAWFIMREDNENGAIRYAKGATDFSANWFDRKNLEYDYFYKTFNS